MTIVIVIAIILWLGLTWLLTSYEHEEDKRQQQIASKFAQQQVSKTDFPYNEIPESWHNDLIQYVSFYRKLDTGLQIRFREKMLFFLKRVKIISMDFTPSDLDYLFLAASAVMPVFHIERWMYGYLKYIILHQQTFGMFKDDDGNALHTAGYINFSHTPDRVHIARNVLWHDFINNTPSNVALHEFMHILDYKDNYMNGIPATMMDKKYIEPWMKLMMKEMEFILQNKSNINSYAGESYPEFLATVCEHYFMQPDKFREEQPNIAALLDKIFYSGNTAIA